jgi:tRNA (guanine37-N1)-methyltransferase
MIFDILTLFPGIFDSPLRESILGKALERGLIEVRTHYLRDYAEGKHQVTDDRPFGGGEGMVMKPEPIARAVTALRHEPPHPRVILLSPAGRLLDQELARELSRLDRLVFICGRYEGVDERIAKHYADDQISIGDYILTGGELAALVVIDAVTRLVPGVLGNEASATAESFTELLLEHPHYTRPRSYAGHEVPDILLSGDHEAVRRWRRGQALLKTRKLRPDLFARLTLSGEERELLDSAQRADMQGEAQGGA